MHKHNKNVNVLSGKFLESFLQPWPYTKRFSLFFETKEIFGWKKQFANDEDLKEIVTSWLRSFAVEEYNIGIEKLIPRYNKCLDSNGDYIEK